ncbi:DUF4349 domain-containing protein [bacterium]|nr:DUF4349 domain-containing protein [bacterium]
MKRFQLAIYLLMIMAILICCASCAQSGGSNMSEPMSGYADTSSSYDGQYREQPRSAMATGGATAEISPDQAYMEFDSYAEEGMAAPGNEMMKHAAGTIAGNDGGGEVDIPSGGVLESIDDWLNPKAWAQESSPDESYIVRTGNIEMEIEDYDKSSAEVQTVAQRHGGIITDSQMQKYGDDMRVGWITMRVPTDKFQQCFDDLKALGDVKVQSVSSEDVTNEFVAGVSRLQALKTEHETLQGMLEDAREVQRTRGLGEAYSVLLETQRRLSEVTTEMQTVENRVSALSDRINRSTITINLSERPIAPPADEFAWGFGAAFENAKKELMYGIRNVANDFINFFVARLIWWIIWIGIIWLAWKLLGTRILRRYRKEQAASPTKGSN